jgi:3-hydroxyacyl-[acyl-carrier-protein] dehydratase
VTDPNPKWDIEWILSVLPHRYPMLLVDRVRSLDPGGAVVAIKNVTASEPCYADVEPGHPGGLGYPQSLVIESLIQAGAVLQGHSSGGSRAAAGVMVFAAITGCRFHGEARPGDVMEHRVRVVRAVSDAVILTGETWVGERCIVRAERLIGAMRPADALLR